MTRRGAWDIIKLAEMRADGEVETLRSAKPPFTGSNPVPPSIFVFHIRRPGGGTGRRNGLKIRRPGTAVPVRVRPRAPIREIGLPPVEAVFLCVPFMGAVSRVKVPNDEGSSSR